MIKVFHLITSLDIGGAEIILRRLLSRMDRSKFENVVASLTGNGPIGRQIRELDVPVFVVGMSRRTPNPIKLLSLRNLLAKERPTILQTWLYHSDLVGLIMGRSVGIRSIVWNIRCADTGEMYAAGLRGAIFRVLTRLSPMADVVVANSHAGKAYHESSGYAPRSWEVVPNGYDTDQFCPQPDARDWLRKESGLSPGNLIIGMVARYDKLKDHGNFLRAAAQFSKQRPDARFVMVGSGICDSNTELMEFIRKYQVADRVRLLGERSDIPRITAGFDVATCTSSSEGFPNTVAEAMACGLPCVATDVGDVSLLLSDAGWVVPPKDSPAIVASWLEVGSMSDESRRKVGQRARRRIVENYSLNAMVRRYEAIYAELVEARP